jgi:hypothetical protein
VHILVVTSDMRAVIGELGFLPRLRQAPEGPLAHARGPTVNRKIYCGNATSLKASFVQAAENCSFVIINSVSAVVIVGSLAL